MIKCGEATTNLDLNEDCTIVPTPYIEYNLSDKVQIIRYQLTNTSEASKFPKRRNG